MPTSTTGDGTVIFYKDPGGGAAGRQITRREGNMDSLRPEYTAELFRHFADLRDGTHGGASSRRDKERLFTAAVVLLDPHARQPLHEINTHLLLGTGEPDRHRRSTPRRRCRSRLGTLMARAASHRYQPSHHPRLLQRRSSPPASAGWHRRRLAAQCVRRGAGGGRVGHPPCHRVGRHPQPGLPARLPHHPGHRERTHNVTIRLPSSMGDGDPAHRPDGEHGFELISVSSSRGSLVTALIPTRRATCPPAPGGELSTCPACGQRLDPTHYEWAQMLVGTWCTVVDLRRWFTFGPGPWRGLRWSCGLAADPLGPGSASRPDGRMRV
jgi:hypothetical protein